MAELTLAAALRDVDATHPEIRSVAIRSLATALLDELGMRPPVWWELIEHPQRDAVVAALELACDDPAPQNAALARVGLAEISAPVAHARAHELLADHDHGDDQDDAAMFSRECGVISLSLIGAAARSFIEGPVSTSAAPKTRTRAVELLARVLDDLRELLTDTRADVRYQAGPALVEVGGEAVEPELLVALEHEQHEKVRANLITAISLLDPPGPAACDVLAAMLDTEEGKGQIGWEAAMALTAARRPEGAPRLVEGLRSRETRDRALEAIAVLGRAASPETIAAVRRYSSGFMVPIFTRVRAAYALARIDPERGIGLLNRLARHPRPAVREAVAEARGHLEQLEQPEPTDHDVYRRE
jgi:HEAT repeat protein